MTLTVDASSLHNTQRERIENCLLLRSVSVAVDLTCNYLHILLCSENGKVHCVPVTSVWERKNCLGPLFEFFPCTLLKHLPARTHRSNWTLNCTNNVVLWFPLVDVQSKHKNTHTHETRVPCCCISILTSTLGQVCSLCNCFQLLLFVSNVCSLALSFPSFISA